MSEIKRVKIDSILESQIPEFLSEEAPLFAEFLKQYYYSLEHQSGSLDLASNIKKYKSIEYFNNETLIPYTTLSKEVLTYDDEIYVTSTYGWPDKYGLIKIDDEIITYTNKNLNKFVTYKTGIFEKGSTTISNVSDTSTLQIGLGIVSDYFPAGTIISAVKNDYIVVNYPATDDKLNQSFTVIKNSFEGCVRGFSGIDQIKSDDKSEFLNFSQTESSEHIVGTNLDPKIVYNLSNLFLYTFFDKFKSEFIPGFEDRQFAEGLSLENILSRARDFYRSKGTDTSYKVLFKVLYDTDIEIIKPQDYTLTPSANNYFTTKNILVEKIYGDDPLLCKGNFLYQNVSGIGTIDASIYNIEYRPVNGKQFYEISLDSTSITGTFKVTGQTKILEDTLAGSATLLVDSTIGFSNSGTILIKPNNSDYIELTYTDKTSNQFLGITGLTQDLTFGLDVVEKKFAYSYIGFGNTSKVDFRIINVIDNIDFSSTSNLRVGDKIKLSGFGKDLNSYSQFNSWIYNIPTKHKIKSTQQINSNQYRFELFDKIKIQLSQVIEISDIYDNKYSGTVTDIETSGSDLTNTNQIIVQIVINGFNPDEAYSIKKLIKKSEHINPSYVDLSDIPAGVQNTYLDKNGDYFYVTATGLPNYSIFATDNKKTVSTVGNGSTDTLYCVDHQLRSGDSIYYQPQSSIASGISTGYYYVTLLNDNNIKLSFSKSDIFSKKYINVNSGITSDTIVKNGFENKTITNQKILKKFNFNKKNVDFDNLDLRSSNNRPVGLLINGVELLSPTHFDENIYYGNLTSIKVTNPGSNYDVVNRPSLEVLDDTGYGVKAHVNISGSVKKIKIISPGIGYQEKPKITISGGNGTGCVLESNLVSSRITSGFKGDIGPSIANNTITFIENTFFENYEEVVYDSNGNNNVPGIINGSHYFVGIVTTNQVKVYNTKIDAVNQTNFIDITGISSGFHYFRSLKNKNTITEVYVKEAGSGYSNRQIRVPSILSTDDRTLGINTFDSYFFAKNHGFSDGDLVKYSSTETPVSGISTTIYHYIHVVDSNKFKLSPAGIGTTLDKSSYLNKKYEKFSNLGLGTHIVEYPPITISVEATSAIGSTTIIAPVLEPVILGSIEDVYLEDGGTGFGCTDIINFNRRPYVGISSIKSQALLKPIIVNGSIVDVKIINKGNGYREDSDIVITGEGLFAEIKPVIANGKLTSVTITNPGIGYDSSNTSLSLMNRGTDAKFLGELYEWKINQVVKNYPSVFQDDDGILTPVVGRYGLQFINFYIPKILRYTSLDNIKQDNREEDGQLTHSPILGWAYDGNPIYGPYGYDSFTGIVRRMNSGYQLNVNTSPGIRPQIFQSGYFINDYVYSGGGDLDECNGRFCKTPEYPDGVYAYFYSIEVDSSNNSIPVYPYIVGKYFYNNPINENFLPSYTQDSEEVFTGELSRNISPYYLNYANSSYSLIDPVYDDYKQEFRIKEINSSGIEDVSIFSAGFDYKVDDIVSLNNKNTEGGSASISVSQIKGKDISGLSLDFSRIDNTKFLIRGNKIKAFTDIPHEINNDESILISGISTVTSSSLEGIKKVTVVQKTVELLDDIDISANTGVSTFITVKDTTGFSNNDFIGIGTEKLLITRVSPERSGFYVNRIENTGFHTVGIDSVRLLPKEYSFRTEENLVDFTFGNYITFFDPKESVGTGTAGVTRTVVGLGTSSFVNRFIPTKSIYLPGHKFYTGQELVYNCGIAGTSLYVNNVGSGVSFKLNQNQSVYAVNLGQDYIGLSTVGFTTSSGIGTTLVSLEFWNFDDSFGAIGAAHSLTTRNLEISATTERTIGIVTTSESHGLLTGDNIKLSIKTPILNTIKIKFDVINRKVLANEIIFSNTDISLTDSSINISNYDVDIQTGDKVLYTAATPITGLINGGVYYVLKTNIDKIQLCEFESDIESSNIIKFSSIGSLQQTISFINPGLNVFEGNTVKFDLSDSSLLDMDLAFYSDSEFTRKIDIIGSQTEGFAIVRSGTPGNVDSYVSLDIDNQSVPKFLYYNLISKSLNDPNKNQLSVDQSVKGNNQIKVRRHSLNGYYNIEVINETSFSFVFDKKLTYIEKQILNTSEISYVTTSKSASGPINNIKINFPGRGYKKLPFVDNIISENGNNAVVKLISPKIGRVESYERVKDGFDYPTDPTLSPKLSVPTVCGIKDILTIGYVGIITGGRKYNTAPVLLVRDNPNIKLACSIFGGSIVSTSVLTNSTELSKPLDIIVTKNSNGYEIADISVIGNTVTLELSNSPTVNPLLSVGFGQTSFVFPFNIGDKIFVENCKLTTDTQSNANFNSSSYDYAFFTVTGINTTNLTVSYNMTGISTGSFGTYNDELSLGVVVNKNDMASFEMVLDDNVSYQSSEKVIGPGFSAIVMENGWDNNLNQLRLIECQGNLNVGDKLFGENSKVNGTVEYFDTFNLDSTLGVTRDKISSLEKNVGTLNDFQQRISDNFYYQKFSYSLKGTIPYNVWRESVKSIVHPSGFREFSDLVLYAKPTEEEVIVGISKSTSLKPTVLNSDSTSLVYIDTELSMYQKDNFARVYEDEIIDDVSEKVFFDGGIVLKPYILNKTNKVLRIDDISEQFTALPGSVVGVSSFKLTNNGTSLFKHEFDSSSSNYINLLDDKFTIINHNYQTGQELIYDYGLGTPIGIATTSYVSGTKDILMSVNNYDGTAVYENGYSVGGVAITTTVTGISTIVSPIISNKTYSSVIGIATTGVGTGAVFNVFITYNGSGVPISTSVLLVSGGQGYSVGDKVSIAGTYLGGTDPTNTLSFYVSKTAPTGISTQSNVTYSSVPSTSGLGSGAIFNIARDNDGRVSTVQVVNGGSGYASTSLISIAGTYVGGSTYDYITVNPLEMGTNKLPKSLFVYKVDDNSFKLTGLSTSLFVNLTGFGTGYHSLSYKDPNTSAIITIDGMVQNCLRRKSINVSLASSVATASTTILNISTGISSVVSGDIFSINDEYLIVKDIGITSSNAVTVQRGALGSISGVHTVGTSVTVLNGNYNIAGDTIYFSTPPYGKFGPVGLETGSSFGGRVFSRKFDPSQPIDKNVILDDISLSFTGIAATEFVLKVNGSTTTTLFNDVNNPVQINNNPLISIDNVLQIPGVDYIIDNSVENTIKFLRGTPASGKISKVAITTGFGYQPRVAAAATVTVSSAGTISNITLTGYGSGYRQPPVISIASTVGSGASITATVGAGGTITGLTIVNPGTGYTTTLLPIVSIGIPTGYSNLWLSYTAGSSGVGQNGKVSVEVGMGSSIISFNLDDPGIGYKVGDILTPVGLTTNPNIGIGFSQFRLTVTEIDKSTFSGVYPGQFIKFDDISANFNGFRKKFTLSATLNGQKTFLSLITPTGSDLNITNNIFIYINDILQIPEDSYVFRGSRVVFTEAPKEGSTCTILYYRGSSVDVEEIDPPKILKEGDIITIKENKNDATDIDQFERVVKKILTSDQLETFGYDGIGIKTDPNKIRPLTWKKQLQDRIIGGSLYSKSRPSLTSLIRPTATIIKKVGESDTSIYVDNAFPLFSDLDNLNEDIRNLKIFEHRTISNPVVTSVVSTSSSISSINIIDGGVGYANTLSPVVTISSSAIKFKDPIYNWDDVQVIGVTSTSQFNSINYGAAFVSVGNSSLYSTSADGLVWQSGNLGAGATINFNSVKSVGVGNSYVILSVGSQANILKSVGYSNTMTSWSSLQLVDEIVVPIFGISGTYPTTYTGTLNEITYGNTFDLWVTVGTAGSVFIGPGVTTSIFKSKLSQTLQDLNSVCFGKNTFVAVGNNGTIITSNNGSFWENKNSPVINNFKKVAYLNDEFVLVGSNGTVVTSSDATTFLSVTTNTSVNFTNIAHYYGFYVALDDLGDLYYSLDLSHWAYRSTLQSNNITDILFVDSVGFNGRYIAVGSAGTVMYAEPIYHRATAVSSVTSGIVTSITITDGGFGYSELDLPSVVVEQDSIKNEPINSFKVVGDYGTIIGVNTFISGTPGIGTTSPKIEFVLKSESYDNTTLGVGYSSPSSFGVNYSQLEKGDYFIITDSNVATGGNLVGISTLLGGMSNYPNSKVGTATSFLDGVYIVEYVTPGSAGIVTVSCNFAPMESDYVKVYKRGPSNTGIGTNDFYGRYSWSKIYDYQNRILNNPQTFDVYTDNGLVGLSTSPKIVRTRGVLS
jgi:hypothetical protein